MATPSEPTHYDVLQVVQTAEAEVIEAAYRRLAQKYHPDVSSDPAGAERMRQINAAHQVLRDPRRRAEYDARLAERSLPLPPPRPPTPPTLELVRPLGGLSIRALVGGAAVFVVALVLGALWLTESDRPSSAGPVGPTRAAEPTRPSTAPAAATPTAALPPALPTLAPPPTNLPATSTPPAATATARPSATPTVDELWRSTLPQLDPLWGADWPRAIALLEAFLAEHPDYGPARDKLYAALLFQAQALFEQGQVGEAIALLQRAQALLPDRGEAPGALQALTPTPTPAPSIRQLLPPRFPAPLAPQPTPTKAGLPGTLRP